jgi:spore coat polysaccharide biosynthesis protein SpsF (cytidylyltransferase family)
MMTEKDDLEHVTKFFYKNWRKHQYKIHNIVSDADYSDIRLAIDSEDDMRIVSAIVMGMNRPPWQYSLEEIIQFYKNINP